MRSGVTTYNETMEIDVLDAEGYCTDRTAIVHCTIVQEHDNNYGADADGRRGVPLTQHYIEEIRIDIKDLPTLTAEEIKQVLKDAEAAFKNEFF